MLNIFRYGWFIGIIVSEKCKKLLNINIFWVILNYEFIILKCDLILINIKYWIIWYCIDGLFGGDIILV